MDVIVADIFSRWYIYLYEKIGIQLHAPTPSQVFDIVSRIIQSIYEHSPPIVRTYCTILNSTIPVQTDIIPVTLAVLILYALFAIIVIVIRGLFRFIYSFIKLSILLAIATTSIYIMLQYNKDDFILQSSPS